MTSTADSVGTDGRIASGSEPPPLSDDAVALRSIWGPARNIFVRHAEAFMKATRYEEASAIADQAAREIDGLIQAIEGEG